MSTKSEAAQRMKELRAMARQEASAVLLKAVSAVDLSPALTEHEEAMVRSLMSDIAMRLGR